MKKAILTGVMAAGIVPLLLSAPMASADFIHKNLSCPGNNKVVVPTGSRFEINDIIMSTNKDQQVTLKFMPGNRIFTKVFMKGKLHFTTNLSGEVESEEEQGLQVDCSGTADTKLSITVTGNGNL